MLARCAHSRQHVTLVGVIILDWVAVTDKSECGRLLAVAFRRRWSGFGQIGSTFGGVGNVLDGGSTMMTGRTAYCARRCQIATQPAFTFTTSATPTHRPPFRSTTPLSR